MNKLQLQTVVHLQGIGRHSQDDVDAIGKEDLKALSEYLGKKKFLTGDKPTKVLFN